MDFDLIFNSKREVNMKTILGIVLMTFMSFLALANAHDCLEGERGFSYCVGDEVFAVQDRGTGKLMKGTIQKLVAPDKAMVQFSQFKKSYEWPISELGVTTTDECVDDGYCIGDPVLNDHGVEGRIQGIFTSYRVAVEYPGSQFYKRTSFYAWPTSRLRKGFDQDGGE
ncbi:MAG: hypothetical protein OXB88_05150 [Bacteriovoracales bacterium]|nr:hypothetical protein [Bacteriovoracales bacterium]